MSAVLVDIGNSAIKWALLGEEHTRVRRCSLEPEAFIGSLAAELEVPLPVLVSSVGAAELEQQLGAKLQQAGYQSVEFCTAPMAELGLSNGYAEPTKMGVDRWFAMLGACQLGVGPWLVVDAGSAITCDLVDAESRHLGGFILPGVRLMEQALQRDTHRVRYAEVLAPSLEPGSNTASCVVAGVWSTCLGAIQQVASQYPDFKMLLTGGDAGTLVGLGLAGEHHPDLVLQGLAARARQRAQEDPS